MYERQPVTTKTKLQIKYELAPNEPTAEQITSWADETRRLIRLGTTPEEAGRQAALRTFSSVGTYIRKSEADSVNDILEALSKK